MTFLVSQFSPGSCYFRPCRVICIPKHLVIQYNLNHLIGDTKWHSYLNNSYNFIYFNLYAFNWAHRNAEDPEPYTSKQTVILSVVMLFVNVILICYCPDWWTLTICCQFALCNHSWNWALPTCTPNANSVWPKGSAEGWAAVYLIEQYPDHSCIKPSPDEYECNSHCRDKLQNFILCRRIIKWIPGTWS